MASAPTLLRVFLASPGDLVDERKILADVVGEINLMLGQSLNVRLELVKWETNVRPGFGVDGQDVINAQVDDQYEIFVGIMWGRFGSPTHRAESGTEEEFHRAYKRLRESPGSVHIMFYFKDAGIPPSKSEPSQLEKVQQFKHKIATEYGGLYHLFETAEQFGNKCRIHLSTLVQDILKSGTSAPAVASPAVAKTAPQVKPGDPLANLAALTDDDYEDGLIDLSERGTDAMRAVASIVDNMSSATSDLGQRVTDRAKEIQQLARGGLAADMKAVKRVANNTAEDLEVFVKRMAVEIPEFHKQHSIGMEAFGKIAMVSRIASAKDREEIALALSQVRKYEAQISVATENLFAFRDAISSSPRMTTAFNRARKRSVAVLDDLVAQLRSAGDQLGGVERLLRSILDNDS